MSDLQLPGFELIEQIGQGGMATVWKARQVSLNRVVAIKFLRSRLARDPADLQRFQTEAHSAAKLKHHGIVQVYDAHLEQGLYYVVMEFVEGYTVGVWLKRKGVIAEKEALLLIDCVADALQYAWNKERIIHCDIKPDNVMVDADGTVKVADLGLARTIKAMTAESPSDEVLGTPAYMSPEQVTGSKDLDFRADVYSLGAMLYHMVTGKILFDGHGDEQVMEMQIGDAVADPLDGNPRLSAGIGWLLEKMLAKEPKDRHESWEAVRADIDRVRRRLLPLAKGLVEGASTIRRGSRRRNQRLSRSRGIRADTPARIGVAAVAGVAIIGAAIAVFIQLRSGAWHITLPVSEEPVRTSVQRPGSTGGEPDVIPPSSRESAPAEPAEAKAAQAWDSARQWVALHPEHYDEGIRRLQNALDEASGTKFASLALDEQNRLIAAREKATEQVMGNLQRTADQLVAMGKHYEAIALYESYTNRMAAETAAQRTALAIELRRQKKAAEDRKREGKDRYARAIASVLDTVAAEVFAHRMQAAADAIAPALTDPVLEAAQGDFARLRNTLAQAAGMDERVMNSFKSQIGEEATVQLSGGKTRLQIVAVKDGMVDATENRIVGSAVATRRIVFGLSDLSARERMERMGSDDSPAVALAKGLMLLNARSFDSAKRYFWMVDPLISERLVGRVEQMEEPAPEKLISERPVGRVEQMEEPAPEKPQDGAHETNSPSEERPPAKAEDLPLTEELHW